MPIDTLGYDTETWLQALKWWNRLTVEGQVEYERRFYAGVDTRIQVRFASWCWKVYAIYLMVKLMERVK